MTTPRVSVVIPTFNRMTVVDRAIESVLSQKAPRDQFEIIVVDDGSTDGTFEHLCSKYGESIRLQRQENGGTNSAYQAGIALARGEIVAQLDSDDIWYRDKLSRCVPLFDAASDVVAVVHNLDVIGLNDGRKRGTWWGPYETFLTAEPTDALSHYLSGEPIRAISSGSLWRRSALLNIMPIPAELWGFHDAYFIRNIIFFGRVCGLKETLGAYYIHESNDYGGGEYKIDLKRAQRHVVETRAMTESFNARCKAFGRVPSRRRTRIQKYALAQAILARERLMGRAATARWLMRNELGLNAFSLLHMYLEVLLPRRLAIFLKNRILARFGSID